MHLSDLNCCSFSSLNKMCHIVPIIWQFYVPCFIKQVCPSERKGIMGVQWCCWRWGMFSSSVTGSASRYHHSYLIRTGTAVKESRNTSYHFTLWTKIQTFLRWIETERDQFPGKYACCRLFFAPLPAVYYHASYLNGAGALWIHPNIEACVCTSELV